MTEVASIPICRVCGNNDLSFHFCVRRQNLWRCKNCNFVQVEREPTTEELDEIYGNQYFTSAKYKDDPVALERENKRRLTLLEAWVGEGSEVLDAGCSTGNFVRYAKDSFAMHGIDYSAFAINVATTANPELEHRLRSGKLEDTDWAGKQFDAICLWDVIEHIWDPVSVLNDLLARLRPNGTLILSTPAIDAFFARAAGVYWPFMTPPEHLSFFALKTFQQALKRMDGAEIVFVERKGKWANLGFIAYKIIRVAPSFFPKFLLWPFFRWPLKKLSIYVPTSDLLYVVIQRTH